MDRLGPDEGRRGLDPGARAQPPAGLRARLPGPEPRRDPTRHRAGDPHQRRECLQPPAGAGAPRPGRAPHGGRGRAQQARLCDRVRHRADRRVRRRDGRRQRDDPRAAEQAERATLHALLTKITAELPQPTRPHAARRAATSHPSPPRRPRRRALEPARRSRHDHHTLEPRATTRCRGTTAGTCRPRRSRAPWCTSACRWPPR